MIEMGDEVGYGEGLVFDENICRERVIELVNFI